VKVAIDVDPIGSYAHRAGDEIHVVLSLVDGVVDGDSVTMRLGNGDRTVRCQAKVTTSPQGVVLDLRAPAKKLGRGVWGLAYRAQPGGELTRLEARLLTGARQPIALIPGPRPATRMPEPTPTAPPAGGGGRVARLVRRVRSGTGRVRRRLRTAG
jgi:hypothetical protein